MRNDVDWTNPHDATFAAPLAELLAMVDGSPFPVVMVGDFNSDADGSTTPTYQDVRDAGFVDAWLIGPPRGPGYTANQAPDLLTAVSQLFHRIDFVFYRDDSTRRTGEFQGAVHAEIWVRSRVTGPYRGSGRRTMPACSPH